VVSSSFDPYTSSDGEEFARLFREEYDREPGLTASRAFDVTTMIIDTVGALDEDEDEEANRQTVFDDLDDARFNGLTGEISFDSDGDYDGDGPHLFQVTDVEFAPLGPVDDYDYG
jgi:ABC-type branched-subunit amino acid transport system substrate-binding protein